MFFVLCAKNRHKKAHPPCPVQCRCAANITKFDSKGYSSLRRYCRRPCRVHILLFSRLQLLYHTFFAFAIVF